MNQRLASELERLRLAVGKHGKITERASVGPVSGAWADSVANVNSLVASLVQPTSEAARVIGAVAKGDLSQTHGARGRRSPARGRVPPLREDRQPDGRAAPLLRRRGDARRPRGRHRRQARRSGRRRAAWPAPGRTSPTRVNSMAGNLTAQVRNIAEVTTAVANGDLSQKITVDVQRRDPRAQEHHQHDGRPAPLVRLRSDARRARGRHRGQARRPGRSRAASPAPGRTSPTPSTRWPATSPPRSATSPRSPPRSPTATCRRKITVDVRGEILELKNTINTMVDQLRSFAAEVTRVAREVGTEGKLGGQAEVEGVSGTWKDLTDSVNSMAGNLTAQVRNIAEVTTAVANGDLSQKDHRRRQGRDPRAQEHRQHDGRPAQLVRRRGDARRARGRHRRQARRPGRRAAAWPARGRTSPTRVNSMAGNLTGAGPQHRRRDEGGRERRPLQEDHRRRARRDPRAQEHDQHDGRPAQLVRGRGDARRARGRHRGQARRSGRRARRRRHVEGPHRLASTRWPAT